MTPHPREMRTAKLELQCITAMAVPLLFLAMATAGKKNFPPWWLIVGTMGFYFIALFLGTVEIMRMGKTPRIWLRVMSSVKTIAWGVSVVIPAVYVFTHR